ncbi:hypothetical protein ABW19_dt0200053 [Dactylella cylindrospora]|nr:hypothetical protein ABW19_dt0200053 [Dactylella cylindrospora]
MDGLLSGRFLVRPPYLQYLVLFIVSGYPQLLDRRVKQFMEFSYGIFIHHRLYLAKIPITAREQKANNILLTFPGFRVNRILVKRPSKSQDIPERRPPHCPCTHAYLEAPVSPKNTEFPGPPSLHQCLFLG